MLSRAVAEPNLSDSILEACRHLGDSYLSSLPAATGNAEICARAWRNQFDNGADGLVIHGSTPSEFAPVLEAYAALRN